MPVTVSLNASRTRAAFRLSHPKGNIITLEMVRALRAGLEGLAENPHLKLLTIEGAGDDFSFGASIPEHTPEEIGRVLPAVHGLIEDLLEVPAVTAAVVRGRCLGGGFELALACDVIFAAETAVFGLPEIHLGVFPPAASVLLPGRVGAARSFVPILTGESRPAADWHADGLVQFLTTPAGLEGAVETWFERHLARKSAAALRYGSAAARASLLAAVHATLPGLERLYLEELMRSHDAVEGVQAFLQKRAPVWQDR
jgi:cyclohexa-1,5-dienecarbonyl-CoA hydratase